MDMKKQTGPSSVKEELTSIEMGKLWAAYIGNTMSTCVLNYYLRHVEDSDIKEIVEKALKLSDSFVQKIKKY